MCIPLGIWPLGRGSPWILHGCILAARVAFGLPDVCSLDSCSSGEGQEGKGAIHV